MTHGLLSLLQRSPIFSRILAILRMSQPSNNKRSLDDSAKDAYKRSKVVAANYLKEADVGIAQYVTQGWDGFDAIIKHRYSDFFVNEIQPGGQVVHLTSYVDCADPKPPMTEDERLIAGLQVPEDKQEAFEQAFVRLDKIIGQDESLRIRKLLEEGEQEGEQEGEGSLLLDMELDKQQRRQVYQVTNNFLPTQVTCVTEDGKLKFVRRANQQQKPRGRRKWDHTGDYCYFVMQKENHDSMDVLHKISQQLRVSPRSFGMAGTKDKRGITVQRCSAFKVDHQRLIGASKKLKGARLGNFSYGPSELKLGDLSGNRFQIVLRHVKGANEDSLGPVLEGIRSTGFINYFGMQRFGTQSVASHSIGVAVLKADWPEAVDLILRPREGEGRDIGRAREIWRDQGDAAAALEAMPRKAALAETSLLRAFAKAPGSEKNAAGAFAAIPRNLRLMYVHAYQSFIWNSAVSQRIAQFGVENPAPGDLVIPAHEFCVSTKPNDATKPTLVTTENAHQFSIYDVVLPLPGWSVEYPAHEVKQTYHELMAKDGLSPFGLGKHPLKEYKLPGAYRHIIIKPRDFGYQWMRYSDDTLPLARSDSDAIEGKHIPESIDFGEHQALKLTFDLPSSAYATMLLRELMRQETASGHHSNLSNQAGNVE